jgi:hypothetical protein
MAKISPPALCSGGASRKRGNRSARCPSFAPHQRPSGASGFTRPQRLSPNDGLHGRRFP